MQYLSRVLIYGAKLLLSAGSITERGKMIQAEERNSLSFMKGIEEGKDFNLDVLKSIFRSAPVGMALVKDRIILEINDMICNMTGYSREEMLGRDSRFLYPSDEEYDFVGREKVRLVHNTGIGSVESKWMKKDGTIFDIALTSSAIDRNDLAKGFTITAIDISARKLAEKKIDEQDRILRQMADTLPGILYQFYVKKSGDVGFHFISSKSREIFGLRNDLPDFFPRFLAHIPEEYHGDFLKSISRSAGSITKWSYVWPFVKDTGETVWVKGISNPSVLNDEIIFDGVVLDITDRIEIEKALKENEVKYRNLVELAVDGILLGSPDFIIMEVNSSMESITGRSRDNLVGTNYAELFTKEALKAKPLMTDLLARGETVITEREITRPDGSVILAEIHSRKMPDGSYQSIFRDITESRKLIENMQRALKLESLATLAGGIAHDFNNILAGISGYIDLARSCIDNRLESAAYLDKSLMIFDRAKEITARLMTFARGGEPVIKPGNLESLLRNCADSAMKGSDINYSFSIDDRLWQCMFDSSQIGQVVYAIVTNAREFSGPDSEINIRAGNCEIDEDAGYSLKPGRYVQVVISDTGTGISPEVMQHIFDPFFTTKNTGNGLGLATSYSIIVKHGGTIEAESKPGRGSTFYFYLPAAPEIAASDFPDRDYQHRGSGTAIIMDDEKFILEITSEMLRGMGYDVIEATDGSTVLNLISDEKKHAGLRFIILDLTVPGGMGGIDTVAAVRKKNISLPVFAASGYSNNPVMASPARYGFTASINKPFRISDLSELLNRHVHP